MTLALEGIRVLDLSRTGPVAHCTMILADFGADVLKVEQPQRGGDRPAGSSVSPHGPEGEREAVFNALNRNKRSIALDLAKTEGRQLFYRLAESADVIIEGFRPGVVKRLGVDSESISQINSRTIYCSLSGYGQDGPYRDRPGHDANYISIAGALALIGKAHGRPILPSNLLADYGGGGMHAALAILLALMARERTGRGQYVDVSMTDGVMCLLTREASNYFLTGNAPRRGLTTTSGALPQYNIYETKDGKYISVACLEPHFYENLCHVLGRDDLIAHRYAKGRARLRVFSDFKKSFLTKTQSEWLRLFEGMDVCIAPVYDFDQVFSDPQVIHRKMVLEIEHPRQGRVKQVGIAAKLAETPGQIRRLSPTLGEHTREVLQSLGYNEKEVGQLYRDEVVQ